MDWVLAGDVVRVANLVVGGMTIAVAGVIAVEYARIYLATQRITPGDWRGLLPRHVTLIATAYIGLTVLTLREVYTRLHEPLSWFGPTVLVLFAMGLWAQWDILGHQRHRLHATPRTERWWTRRARRRQG